jgi:cytochrome P450
LLSEIEYRKLFLGIHAPVVPGRREVASERPVIDFDHHAPDFDANKTYRELRERCPVAFTNAHGGFWVLSRYRDIANVARNDDVFSSARDAQGRGGMVIPEWTSETSIPIELDPPEQMPYRRMLNHLFSAEKIENLKPLIAALTAQTIDTFIERGQCDLVNDFASPVPARVTVHLLGLSPSHADRFARAIHDVFGSAPMSERAARGVAEMEWVADQLSEQIKRRRVEPSNDIISYLCAQTIDGAPLNDDVVLSIAKLIVGGGMDTTTSLTGQTLVWLSANPDERQRLIDDPALLLSATEEFLRVFAPSQSMARTVTEAVEIDGCVMQAGDRVLVPWVAADFDETMFENPDDVVLDRTRNRHLAFGLGYHRCVGSHLAKAMFQEMMTQAFERFPDYRVLTDGLVPYASHGNQTGWDVVPAVFTPGEKRGAANA